LIHKPYSSFSATVVLADQPFEHVGEQSVPLRYVVHHVRGANLVTQGGKIYRLEGDKLLDAGLGQGLGAHPLPTYPEGIDPLWMDVDAMQGSWPSSLWAWVSGMWVSDGARIYSPFSDTYRGNADQFTRVAGDSGSDSNLLTPWSGGRVIGFADGSFRILSGDKKLVPKLSAGKGVECPVRIDVKAVTALPTGDLYALGRGKCDDNAFLIEHWTDAAVESKSVEPLPAAFSAPLATPARPIGAPESVWLRAVAPDTIYAIRTRSEEGPGQVRIARFTGIGWFLAALPADEHLRAYDVAPDGSLWVILGNTPYRLSGKTWSGVLLPILPSLPSELDAGASEPQPELSSVLGLSVDRAYFGGLVTYKKTNYEGGLILATGEAPLHLPETSAKAADAGVDAGSDAKTDLSVPDSAPTSFSAACTTPFVVLFSVSQSAPADFEYPATRDALLASSTRPAVKFVEFTYRGRRTLGASATTADDANALVRLIAERVKGSKPTLVCYAPASIIREVKFTP
jgi:hypothetical protein